MRIALDATPLIEPAGGIPRYVVELARSLAIEFPGDEIHLLTDQQRLFIPDNLRERPNIVLEPPTDTGWLGKWWASGLPRELRRRRIDVFHGVNFAVPYALRPPSALTLHDLSPWKPPPIRPPGSERVRRRTPMQLRLARRILTPTEAVRSEAIARFGLSPEKVIAIPHAAGLSTPSEAEVTATLDRLGVPQPYLLALGAASERKNIAGLVAAWRLAGLSDTALVVAGAGSGAWNDAGNSRIFGLGSLSDTEIAALLSGATAFVYPSLYEGFGLPLLEAMEAGVPVITSHDAALTEVSAGAALHADATRPESLAAAIQRIVTDAELRRRLQQAGRRRSAQFSWRVTAERTRAAYEQAIG